MLQRHGESEEGEDWEGVAEQPKNGWSIYETTCHGSPPSWKGIVWLGLLFSSNLIAFHGIPMIPDVLGGTHEERDIPP